jgi:phospholipase A-2-activating protein
MLHMLTRSLGCADKHIRIFSPSGKLLHTVKASTDVVRALCRVPADHPSKADFASAGNDGVIRLWRLDGRQVGELHGHENFIYSLVSLPSGELASSGEDRTVRIWRGSECVQTITHPAISVWGVAACSENGDIVSGASDRKVRIFSRRKERQAEPEVIQAFEDSVKSSSIPQQQMGDVQKDKLPGPEFLTQKSGTKEGQVVMVREANGSVGAYQWSQGAHEWLSVGTVVDAVGSSGRKVDYAGKSYDYVFDVDIEDGKPPLKLPFDLSQNPYEAATKFIQDNELPATYLDQVANFIITNTQGATLGQTSQPQPAGSDPYGMENRYRPGDAASTSSPAPTPATTSRPKVLPQTTYLSIKTANLRTILKKTQELNQQLINEGSKDLSLNDSQLSTLSDLISSLETLLSGTPPQAQIPPDSIPLALHIATAWPPAFRLPGLDLLRLLTASSSLPASYTTSTNQDLIALLAESGVFADKDRPNNIMLATRTLSNLFETPRGRELADLKFDQTHQMVKEASKGSTNRNLKIAAATLWVNYAVLLTSATHSELPSSLDRAITLLDDLSILLRTATDSEAVYRALVAVGTLLTLGEDATMAAKDVYDYAGVLKKAESTVREPRVKGVVAEIREALK